METVAFVREARCLSRAITSRDAGLAARSTLTLEGTLLPFVSSQLGHADIGTTSIYLRGLAPQETIDAIAARPRPTLAGTPTATSLAQATSSTTAPRTKERP